MATKRSQVHDTYPLRTVTQITGLSADIVRAWEKRYGVVSPVRGPRGARLYTRADIARLRILARAVDEGRAIGDVAKLSAAELAQLVSADTRANEAAAGSDGSNAGAAVVERALAAVEHFDSFELNRNLGDGLSSLGCSRFLREVCAPLLTRVGERWHAGELSIAHEHMVTAAVCSLTQAVIRSRGAATKPQALLATPSGERHEAGLLLVAALLVDAGVGLVYLGADVPADDIVAAATETGVTMVGISLSESAEASVLSAQLRTLERRLPESVELWAGGAGARAAVARIRGSRIEVLADLAVVEERAAELRARRT